MYRPSIPETTGTKALVALLCGYEVVAICSGRVPTITALHHRKPLIGITLIGALVVHFWTPNVPRLVSESDNSICYRSLLA